MMRVQGAVPLVVATAVTLALAGCGKFSGDESPILGSWQPITPDVIESVTFSANGTVVVRKQGVDNIPVDYALDTLTVPATLIMDGQQGTIRFLDDDNQIEITDHGGLTLRFQRVP